MALELITLSDHKVFVYHGHSMDNTFSPCDILCVIPLPMRRIHPGDVIAFHSQSCERSPHVIVHRVLARVPEGLITQGDAYMSPDTGVVSAAQLVGRVIQRQCGDKSYIVWGGFAGRMWARYLRFRRRFLALGRAPYNRLRASGVVRHLWRPPIANVTLATAYGPMVKYLHARETIAIWQPETGTYWCRKPYDLVLDAPGPTTNEQRINE